LDAAATFRPDDLTMSLLAERVGLSKPALYRYFPNKAALLRALADRTVAANGFDDVDRASWDRYLVSMGLAIYDLFEKSPVLLGDDTAAQRVLGLRLAEGALRQLIPAGFDAGSVAQTLTHVGALVKLAAEQAASISAESTTPEDIRRLADDFAAAADAEFVDAFAVMFDDFDARSNLHHNLEVMVAGLRATHHTDPTD
jgi:AcrR family transcriptional regulator